MTLEELREKEEELEKRRMEYLEMDNNRMAKRVEKELYKTMDLIEVKILEQKIDMKRELKIYKEFIKNLGLEERFNEYREKEIKRKEY